MKTRRLIVWLLAVLMLCSLTVTAFAAGQTNDKLTYVTDTAGLLTQQQKNRLEERAAQISSRYNFGVYIIATNDYHEYSNQSTIYDCLMKVHDQYQLGCGDDLASAELMLSMNDRDYAFNFASYSDRQYYVFTEAGRDYLEDRVVEYFYQNDFYGGFNEYLNCCEEYLAAAEQGNPIGEGESSYMDSAAKKGPSLLTLLPGIIVSAITGTVLTAPMKSAKIRHEANEYAVPGSLHLTHQADVYTHRTVTRTPRQTRSSGGGGASSRSTHYSSGHQSGRSGKF